MKNKFFKSLILLVIIFSIIGTSLSVYADENQALQGSEGVEQISF